MILLMWSILTITGTIALKSEEEGRRFIEELDRNTEKLSHQVALAEWVHAVNINEKTDAQQEAVTVLVAKWANDRWKETMQYPWETFKDEELKRKFKLYSTIGSSALEGDKYEDLKEIESKMKEIYSTAMVCDYGKPQKCDLLLDPDLGAIMANSRDPEELKHIWKQWRDSVGPKIKHMYVKYVNLSNEAAKANNYESQTQYWLKDYEDPNFRRELESLWEQLKPLYLQLHAYVRQKLAGVYGESVVPKREPLPAHLLGNMWAQGWSDIHVIPYPEVECFDVTPQLMQQGYTPLKMFRLAENFYTSINLSAMPESFWTNSVIERRPGIQMDCHPTAYDLQNSQDFRIKMCTKVTMNDLFTIHHEMGHVEYYLQYKDLPNAYRGGANSGFHEAVGDAISLSVSTEKHLKKLGLLKEVVGQESPVRQEMRDINQLFFIALSKVTLIPYSYIVDQWRWAVFDGKVNEKNYNCWWWALRHKYQGLQPPIDRSENDFDIGSKYHVVADFPYIRYFVSLILQFQFHKAMCQTAGQYEPGVLPLHQCDIYGNVRAGNLLKRMLKMGASKPWQEALYVMTGQKKMDAGAMLEYFDPLMKWLQKENTRLGSLIGWEDPTYKCK